MKFRATYLVLVLPAVILTLGFSKDEKATASSSFIYFTEQNGISMGITSDGELNVWGFNGLNDDGFLGIDLTENQSTPQYIDVDTSRDDEIITDAGTWVFNSWALTETGELFMWGTNEFGEMGNGTEDIDTRYPTKVDVDSSRDDEEIIQFNLEGSGSRATASAITDDGSLYMWGFNLNGEVGNGTSGDSNNSVLTPYKVDVDSSRNDEVVIDAGVSYQTSWAITDDGSLFTWGQNKDGQTGTGSSNGVLTTPTEVDLSALGIDGREIIEVGSDNANSYFLTSQGEMYVWGFNNSYALGDGTQTDKYTPQLVDLDNNSSTTEFIVDGKISAQIGYALTSDNELFMWGNDAAGIMGNGPGDESTYTNTTPARINVNNQEIVKVDMNNVSMLALTNNNDLYLWGNNQYGQLGFLPEESSQEDTGTYYEPSPVLFNPFNDSFKVQTAQFNYQSTFITDTDGNFYTFGANEYGQMGQGTFGPTTSSPQLVLPYTNPIDNNPDDNSGLLTGAVIGIVAGGAAAMLAAGGFIYLKASGKL